MADWMLPNSSTQSLFSSILGENIGSSTAVSESNCEGESGFPFHGSHEHHASTNPDYRNGPQDHTDADQTTGSWAMFEQQISSNEGLLDRMASAGFNDTVLNTETIRNGDFTQNWEVLSPYLTIPSGLSPTTLLESPAFASNSPYSKTFNLDELLSDPNHLYASSDKVAQSPPIDEEQDGKADAEDGYNWRKYGQKQGKGSDSLQGYYKCSHSHCLVKKKVELSQEDHITEIIYKGTHNHPKPSPTRGSSHLGSSVAFNDNPELASSATNTMLGAEYNNGTTTFSYDEDEDDDEHGTLGIVSVACDGDGDESESKKRKANMSISGATRSVKDPKVVVQTTSEVDILDDGYKWRKYGQKVVKGNPNPRSYYKCTSAGCAVRKHVERASHNLNSVITTYEGKHNHDIPCARNNNNHHVNSDQVPSNNGSVQHRPEHSQLHNNVSQFQRTASFGSFGLLTGPRLIPPHDHLGYRMNQHWGLNQGQQYMGQPRYMNEMESMVQPKVEPMYDSGLSLPNASAVYQQVMSRMPIGPQM